MVPSDNIWLLGSFYIFTVHTQIQNINCDILPPSRLRIPPRPKKLSLIRPPFVVPPVPPENYRLSNPWLNETNSRGMSPKDKKIYFYYSPTELFYAKNLYLQQRGVPKNTENRIHSKKLRFRKPLRVKEADCFNEKVKPVKLKNQNSKLKYNSPFNNHYNVPATYMLPPTSMEDNFVKYQDQRNEFRHEQRPVIDYENNEEEVSYEESDESRPLYVRDHAPESENEDYTLENENSVQVDYKERPNPTVQLSSDGDRVEFQVQGHDGPKTYIFGFDTGEGNNRQFRLEERLKDGTVKGQYGYYDARGKLKTIKYVARPMEGYQEQHHEVNSPS